MRKRSVLAALVAGGVSIGAFTGVQADTAPAGGGEGCIAHSPAPATAPPGNIVYGNTCTYLATRTAGYATAAQTWSVTVWASKAAKDRGEAPVKSASSAASSPCAVANFMVPGNVAVVTVSNGIAAAGNPFPTGAPESTTDHCQNF